MDFVWTALMFCLGIGLLVKGSDWLVDAAARIAKQFGISTFIIGITIVAVGTSLPEFAASVTASFYGNGQLALGNIIGSNVANIALIAGLAGLFAPIALKRDLYNRDGTILLGATVLFYLFSLGGIISRVEGGFFLFCFFAYMLYFVVAKRPYKKAFHFRRYLGDSDNPEEKELFESIPRLTDDVRRALADNFKKFASATTAFFRDLRVGLRKNRLAFAFFAKQIAIFAIGVACIFFGANFVVTAAKSLPISQLAIGLFFVAIGTSLPEISVTIASLRKGIPEIMIGNLIGSNIANILLVGGFAAIVNPIIVPPFVVRTEFVFLLLTSWLFLVFLRSDRKITAIEALTLLLVYAAFVATTASAVLIG